MNVLISVITPLYNASKTIIKTIQSVQNQSVLDWEMIIVDDCSTDNSFDIVDEYIKTDSRIKLIKSEWNGGAAVARNVAIAEASGRFIAFLDADDTWHKEKLKTQSKFMLERSIDFSYMPYNRYHESGRLLSTFYPPMSVNYKNILKTNSIGCLTAMYDTERIGKVFMPNISKRQDLGLWLKILKKTDYAYCCNEVLSDYLAVQSNSISSNKISVAKYQWRIYREVEKMSFVLSVYNFFCYAYFGFMKTK